MDSRTLFAGAKEVLILHHGEPYRLRETRQGKLILTK
ncbi:MAG: hemin uptake protein HemP [Rhodocyclaceae bacterium]|nr:hemin uptake protein HemP [Rhodocyclaceae bacterium]